MTAANLPPIIHVMAEAARRAARQLSQDFHRRDRVDISRKASGELVTSADIQAEQTIREALMQARPQFGFLGEESGDIAGNEKDARWIVDPLDGTSNFLHGIPHFCISLAVEEKRDAAGKGEITAAVIMQPITGELFWAQQGRGAYYEDRRMHVSTTKQMDDALLATGSASLHGKTTQHEALMHAFGKEALALRCSGSAALDLAYVANSRYDGFWQKGLNPWDIAAGSLLVREAGGVVRDFRLSPDVLTSGNILASNSNLSAKLDKLLAVAAKKA